MIMMLLALFFTYLQVSICLKLKGSDYIIKRLEQYNVKNIFGYIGGCNLELFDSLYKSTKLKPIIHRNEQYSGYCAEGYAKALKNTLGVIFTTSGPGLTNIITPLQDAYSDGIPLLAISGQVAKKKLGTSAFQECDAVCITKSCTKYNRLVTDIQDLEESLDTAISIALMLSLIHI